MMRKKQIERIRDLDRKLVESAKDIKILSRLSWAPETAHIFIQNYEAGNKQLPSATAPEISHASEIDSLQFIVSCCDDQNPLEAYLKKTAISYITAAEMLASAGTPTFTEKSIALYGAPSESIFSGTITHRDAAKTFLDETSAYAESAKISDDELCILPDTVVEQLRKRINAVFTEDPILVELDATLASKAAAGSDRVRIRNATCFSQADIDQLAEHECFVHSLTSINGKRQPLLSSMGLGAPRTTRTQEGLAIFAEMITHAMDLNRLRRIALRVLAISMGLEGADFIEIYEFFLNNGQSPFEAFQSTYRVFRGGDPRGGVVFTKDISYLAGFSDVHTFFRWAIKERKLAYPHHLCAGRMTLGDILSLEEYFDSGTIQPPHYEPAWIKSRPTLLAFLLYTNFLNVLELNSVSAATFASDL